MSEKTTAEWLEMLTGHIPIAPIYDSRRHLPIRSLRPRAWCSTVPHPAKPDFKMLSNPLKIDGVRPEQTVCSAAGRRQRGAARARQSPSRRGVSRRMKLEGLKVVDLSVFLPGPYLTMALADHGAEVIKVEPPGEGDPGRHIGLSDGPSTVFFRNVNRGKKSVVIDLKTAEGRESLLKLCDSADVFVESYRPGVMQRLGIDYATVADPQSSHRLLLDQRLRPGRSLSRPAGARSRHHGAERRAQHYAGAGRRAGHAWRCRRRHVERAAGSVRRADGPAPAPEERASATTSTSPCTMRSSPPCPM